MSPPNRAADFEPASDELVERWAKYGRWDRPYFPSLIGMEIEEVRRDYCRMRLPFRDDLVAEGWIVRRGRTVVFCESEARAASTGKLVARAVLTFNVAVP